MNRFTQPRRPDNLTPSRPDLLPRLGSKLPVTVTVNLKIELELETLAPSREAELRLDYLPRAMLEMNKAHFMLNIFSSYLMI